MTGCKPLGTFAVIWEGSGSLEGGRLPGLRRRRHVRLGSRLPRDSGHCAWGPQCPGKRTSCLFFTGHFPFCPQFPPLPPILPLPTFFLGGRGGVQEVCGQPIWGSAGPCKCIGRKGGLIGVLGTGRKAVGGVRDTVFRAVTPVVKLVEQALQPSCVCAPGVPSGGAGGGGGGWLDDERRMPSGKHLCQEVWHNFSHGV